MYYDMRCRGYFSIDWFLDGHSFGFLDVHSLDLIPDVFALPNICAGG